MLFTFLLLTRKSEKAHGVVEAWGRPMKPPSLDTGAQAAAPEAKPRIRRVPTAMRMGFTISGRTQTLFRSKLLEARADRPRKRT